MSRLRSTPTAASLADRLRQVRQATRAQRAGVEGSTRELVLVAFGLPVVTLAILLVVMLAVLLMAGSGLTGLASAVAASWMALHQIPVALSGTTIGVLPMIPTLAILAGTFAFVYSAADLRRSRNELITLVAAAVGGPILVTAVALAVVIDGSSVLPIQSPDALIAFVCTIGVHGLAAGAAIGWRRRAYLAARMSLTGADLRGVRTGATFLAALLAVGAVLVVVRLVWRFHQVGVLLGDGSGFDGYLSLTVLSVLYLPNLVVGAAAVLVGSDAHIGMASVDLLSVHGGPVPPLPALAVLPDGPGIGLWGIVGLVIPAVIAGVLAWRCRSLDPVAHVRSIGVAAALSATGMAILAALAGGRLGEIGDAGPTVVTASVFTLGWMGVVGLVVALIHGVLPATRAARDAADDWVFDEWADSLDDEWTDPDGFDDDYVTEAYDDWYDEYGDEAYADAEHGDQEDGDGLADDAAIGEIGDRDRAADDSSDIEADLHPERSR